MNTVIQIELKISEAIILILRVVVKVLLAITPNLYAVGVQKHRRSGR